MKTKELHHLLYRAAFGPTPQLVKELKGMTREQAVNKLFDDAERIQDLLIIPKPETNDKGEVGPLKTVGLILKSQKEKDLLNLAWIDRMTVAKASLREKMIFFWHNHFATSAPFGWLMQVQHNTLRRLALGSFSEMLHEISKDPAMIIWLNNQQNKKNAPNENFAREVMELFTLGEGNGYTEQDIKEAARAFTGWFVNQKGEFEFNEKQHDDNNKTVFGNTGNWNGNHIIDFLLTKPETATYICRKIYKTFVNNTVDEKRVVDLAVRFRASSYNIENLMRHIFMADWFYETENIGAVICSPVELIVRYKKLVQFQVDDKQQLAYQDLLGQTLFSPPNVAGWKGGRAWIDSSTLLFRLNIPATIINSNAIKLNKRPAFEEKDRGEKPQKDQQVAVKSDWGRMVNYFKDVPAQQLTDEVIQFFITAPTIRISKAMIDQHVDTSTPQRRIITTIAAVMKLPEFQLI
jgi:uncharacterized protein (DUF1800 family)